MYARLAQSVEHETLNLRVVGSSPTLGASFFFFFFFFSHKTHTHIAEATPIHKATIVPRGDALGMVQMYIHYNHTIITYFICTDYMPGCLFLAPNINMSPALKMSPGFSCASGTEITKNRIQNSSSSSNFYFIS